MAVFEERKNRLCFTEIGTGVLPIQDIVDTAAKLPNLDSMFLEQDHTTWPEIESIRRSLDAFSAKFTGITWPLTMPARPVVARRKEVRVAT